MTPAQLETAARELCLMRGINFANKTPSYEASTIRHATEEIERFAQVGTAIAAAMQQVTPRKTRKKVVAGS
jgi:hypothetical protein